ncbi:hypothetical protein DYH09_18290 [bacterium CPR1]|nr:hypothetical protein [bacterium CPR1]
MEALPGPDQAEHTRSRVAWLWLATAIQRMLARLATWVRWAYRKGHLVIDLAEDLPGTPNPRFQRPATSAEMVQLLGVIDRSTTPGRRDLALLETLYGIGLRRYELLAPRAGPRGRRAGLLPGPDRAPNRRAAPEPDRSPASMGSTRTEKRAVSPHVAALLREPRARSRTAASLPNR